MQDPLAELAGYFCRRTTVPDQELIRLAAAAGSGGGTGQLPARMTEPGSRGRIMTGGLHERDVTGNAFAGWRLSRHPGARRGPDRCRARFADPRPDSIPGRAGPGPGTGLEPG